MTKHTLYLFPDTNLFIQCHPLEKLDWSEWAEFEEVHLIVCRPVHREIDNQKGRGNNRVSQRARTTYGIFRSVISGQDGYHLVRNSGPRVKLYLEGPSLPSQDLKDTLDYSKPDDEVVGCLHRFREEHPNEDARLLTHDGGPMMTAKSLGLPFVAIQEDWILSPENNEAEREVAHLKSEIDRLKKSEPSFQVRCLDDKDQEIELLEVECKVYEPLADQEIEELIDRLKRRFPITTDFGDKERTIRLETVDINVIRANSILMPRMPPSATTIANYRDREYPNWIQSCKEQLTNLHKALQRGVGQPYVRFAIENRGTRPGRDTLIEFIAKGDFRLFPPQEDFPEWFREEEETSLLLPPPPKPPRSRSLTDDLVNMRSFRFPMIAPPSLLPNLVPQHDPNAFYYKPSFPPEPADSIRLACDQWRHGLGAERFVAEIYVNANSHEITGQLECVVQAENISSPVRKGVRVKINVTKMNTKDHAYGIVSGPFGS